MRDNDICKKIEFEENGIENLCRYGKAFKFE